MSQRDEFGFDWGAGATEEPPGFLFAAGRVHRNEVWIVAGVCLAGGLLVGGLVNAYLSHPAAPYVAGVAALVAFGLGIRRGFQMELRATADTVFIRNFWRSHPFAWTDVEWVVETVRMPFNSPLPALRFHLRNGKSYRADAMPVRATEVPEIIEKLRRLSPDSVDWGRTPGLTRRSFQIWGKR